MIKFLDKPTILAFHRDQVKTYGGEQGIRDENLLESALAQPKVKFDRKFLHKTIFEKAAVYGFHLCKNHPFIDGNKRTSLVAMYTFLFVNGYRLQADKKTIFATVIELANGSLEKEELATFLEENSVAKS